MLPLNSFLILWDNIFDVSNGGSNGAWPIIGLLALIKASEHQIIAGLKRGQMSYQSVMERCDSLDWPFYSIKLVEMRGVNACVCEC